MGKFKRKATSSRKFVSKKATTFKFRCAIIYLSKGEIEMKTNIQKLIKLITKEEKDLGYLLANLRSHLFNISIEELDGRCKIIEDYKSDFEEELNELDKLIRKIVYHKNILFEKCNTFKLKDGRTIQQAVMDNMYLRRHKTFFENIVDSRLTKMWGIDANGTYFESYDLIFEPKMIKERLKEINEKIEATENEIAKIKLIEFTI